MSHSLRRVMLLLAGCTLIVVAGVTPVSATPPSQVGAPPPDVAAIDAHVQRQMERSSIPGLAYAVVQDGAIVHLQAFGIAGSDGRPMTAQTPMYIGSVGKTFTALAVRQLVNAGKLQLTAPVQRYLPWFRLADAEASSRITVRHLLEHASGLSTFAGNDFRLYRAGRSSEDLARSLASMQLNRPVGDSYEYSNLNYLILGIVIEAVNGQSYEQYMEQHIFDPLEMTHSYVSLDPARADGMADGYRFLYGIPVAVDVPHPQGQISAGFHISTAEDMARYLIAFADRGKYGDVSIVAPDGKPGGPGLIYNIDWEPVITTDPGFASGHAGGWLNFSAGLIAMPLTRTGVVVLTNANPTQLLAPKSAFEISHDVLRMYGSQPPNPDRPTLTSQYLIVDAVLLAVAAFIAFRLFRRRGRRDRLTGRMSQVRIYIAAIIIDLVLPLLILLGLPLAMAYLAGDPAQATIINWGRLFFQIPDLGYFAFTVILLWLVAGVIRLVWLIRPRVSRPTLIHSAPEIRWPV